MDIYKPMLHARMWFCRKKERIPTSLHKCHNRYIDIPKWKQSYRLTSLRYIAFLEKTVSKHSSVAFGKADPYPSLRQDMTGRTICFSQRKIKEEADEQRHLFAFLSASFGFTSIRINDGDTCDLIRHFDACVLPVPLLPVNVFWVVCEEASSKIKRPKNIISHSHCGDSFPFSTYGEEGIYVWIVGQQ